MHDVMLVAAAVVAFLMVGTWVASVFLENASIADIVWGLGFVLVAWAVRPTVDGGNTTRQWLIVAMTTIWGLRLAIYLFARNAGKGEDFRYRAMRRHHGARFPLVSLVTVFVLQGVLMWVVSLPLQLGQLDETPSLGLIATLGVALWAAGMVFETVGDLQLRAFKSDPASAGKVLDTGLWRYTRHPNYFGDACAWWGIGLVAAETATGKWALVGPLLMTILLRRVSGVTLLEKSLIKRRAGYADYVATTSPFFPRIPRRR